MKKYFKNSTGTFKINIETMTSTSYDWYVLGKQYTSGYVVNNYNYSATTIKHIVKLKEYLSDNDINYVAIEAPKGLQNLELAKKHYQDKYSNLLNDMNKKGTRKAKNIERREQAEKMLQTMAFIDSLMNEVSDDKV